ncbi:MAG: tetratricopeptide repeat-containing sensor histidine kinase [Bacteroidetes bacterium]|nr:tetratricopeptide repeat-containing sensor histidine kinase [Bacteroidota bacterium]
MKDKAVFLFFVAFFFLAAINNLYSGPDTSSDDNPDALISKFKETGDTLLLWQVIEIAEAVGNHSLLGEAYRQLGLYHSNFENGEKSIAYLIRALDVFETINDVSGMAKTNLNLGFVYYGMAEIELALEFTKRAVEKARIVGDPFMLSIILGNIGTMYEKQDDGFEAALEAYTESLELSLALQDSVGMYSNYNNLGVLYEKSGQIDKAREYYTRALDLTIYFGNTLETCRIQTNLASLDIREKDYKAALVHLNNSKQVCEGVDVMLRLHRLDLMSTALAGLGNYKEAWEAAVRFYKLNDSVFKVERVAAINELSQKYEAEKKAQQISLLEKDITIQKEVAKKETYRRNLMLLVTGFILVILVLVVIRFYEKGKLNKKLEASEKQLQRLNHDKDRFFGILSHNLRNPLMAFEGLSNQLTKPNAGNNVEVAQQMNSYAKQLISLLNNLLLWSKNEQGLLVIKPQALLLDQIIEEAVTLYKPLASTKNIQLQASCPKDILVFADKESLQTIVRNLLNNAIKFTDEGGVAINCVAGQDRVEVSINDTGKGMDRQQLNALFQLGANHQSGLGLLLCKELADKNGIGINIESEKGKGTTVKLHIPIFVYHEDRTP